MGALILIGVTVLLPKSIELKRLREEKETSASNVEQVTVANSAPNTEQVTSTSNVEQVVIETSASNAEQVV